MSCNLLNNLFQFNVPFIGSGRLFIDKVVRLRFVQKFAQQQQQQLPRYFAPAAALRNFSQILPIVFSGPLRQQLTANASLLAGAGARACKLAVA